VTRYVRPLQTKQGEEKMAVFQKEEKHGLEESHFEDFVKVRK
jgi:hypothetical protein